MADDRKKRMGIKTEKPAPKSDDIFDNCTGEDSEEKGNLLTDGLKKIFTVGVSAAFLTEESLRRYIQDLKLPKEVLNLLLQSASKSKDQLMGRVGNEIISIIQKIDFVKEASRFVETHKFRVSAEIEVVKKEKAD